MSVNLSKEEDLPPTNSDSEADDSNDDKFV